MPLLRRLQHDAVGLCRSGRQRLPAALLGLIPGEGFGDPPGRAALFVGHCPGWASADRATASQHVPNEGHQTVGFLRSGLVKGRDTGRCVRRSLGFRHGRQTVAPELIQFALRPVRLAIEVHGAAAQAQDVFQRQIRCHRLPERIQGMESEADDVGGQSKFFLRLGPVVREQATGGMARRRQVTAGARQEQQGEVAKDLVQDGRRDDG